MYCSVYLGYRTRRVRLASPRLASRFVLSPPPRVPAYDFVRRDPDQRANFRPGVYRNVCGMFGDSRIRSSCVCIQRNQVVWTRKYRQILIGKSSCVSMGYGIKWISRRESIDRFVYNFWWTNRSRSCFRIDKLNCGNKNSRSWNNKWRYLRNRTYIWVYTRTMIRFKDLRRLAEIRRRGKIWKVVVEVINCSNNLIFLVGSNKY